MLLIAEPPLQPQDILLNIQGMNVPTRKCLVHVTVVAVAWSIHGEAFQTFLMPQTTLQTSGKNPETPPGQTHSTKVTAVFEDSSV